MNPRRWYRYLRDRWEALRGSYWFLPGQMALFSVASALAAIELDRRLPLDRWPALSWMVDVSIESSRAVLSTIAGSMMTVTGVVFSITMVALTLTSSQFGPRLLRTFFRDRSTQISLGFFLSTFLYSLLVLRGLESPGQALHLATAGAVGLAILSLFVLIFFIHHTANSLQASSVIAAVAREIHVQIPILFPEPSATDRSEDDESIEPIDLEAFDADAASIVSQKEGYVRILDEDSILALAHQHDLVICMEVRAGSFVTTGSSICRVAPEAHLTSEIEAQLLACCVLGDRRTPVQDICFLTQQLSEMAVRALSSGVNDPKTAVECIQRLGSAVAAISGRAFPSGSRCDEEGNLRTVFRTISFEDFTMSCFDSIRYYGAHDPQVAATMLHAVGSGGCGEIPKDRRACLSARAHEIWEHFEETSRTQCDRDRALVRASFDSSLRALGVDASPS